MGNNNLDPAVISGQAIATIADEHVPGIADLVRLGEEGMSTDGARSAVLEEIAEEHVAYNGTAADALAAACDKIAASREEEADPASDAKNIKDRAVLAKVHLKVEMVDAARHRRSAEAELPAVQSRLRRLVESLTGNPDGEVREQGFFKKWQAYLIPLAFILVMEGLVGVKAFEYFSNNVISWGLTFVALFILFTQSNAMVNCVKMETTRQEVIAELERREEKPEVASRKAFALPVDIASKFRRAKRAFWGTIIAIGGGRLVATFFQETLDPVGVFAALAFIGFVVAAHVVKLNSDVREYPRDLVRQHDNLLGRVAELEADRAEGPLTVNSARIAEIANGYNAERDEVVRKLDAARAAAAEQAAALSRMWSQCQAAPGWFAAQAEELTEKLMQNLRDNPPEGVPADSFTASDVAAAYAAMAPKLDFDGERVSMLAAPRPPSMLVAPSIGEIKREAWDEILAALAREEDAARREDAWRRSGLRRPAVR